MSMSMWHTKFFPAFRRVFPNVIHQFCGMSTSSPSLLQDLAAQPRESNLIKQFRAAYGRWTKPERNASIISVATLMSIDPIKAQQAAKLFTQGAGGPLSMTRLRDELTPPYEDLFSAITRDNGLGFLLTFRAVLFTSPPYSHRLFIIRLFLFLLNRPVFS